MTLRRVKKRSALPVLAALLVGSTTAGAATMLAGVAEVPLVGDAAVLAATYSTIERAPDPIRHVPPRQTSSSTQAAPTKTSNPPTTTTAPTSVPPPRTTTPPPSTLPAPPSQPEPPSNQPDRVVALVNEARAASGCAALRVEEHLTAAATAHSSDMSDRNYFSHTTPEGVTFDERIKNAGYPLPGGENIAQGQRSAAQVMDAWMNSAGHKANILNCEFKAIGVGLDIDGWYWTQNFGY